MRYCQHCCQTVTLPVYKKHKEEFYDARSKQWAGAHRSTEEKNWRIPDPSLDVEDDEIIFDAINSTGTHFY